jgi:diaminopimelate decarboxylase
MKLGKELSTRFKDICKIYGRQLQLWFEPGKFLVSECGYLLVKVNTVKQTMATVFVGVDSGQNHLIRPCSTMPIIILLMFRIPPGAACLHGGRIHLRDRHFCMGRKLHEVREGDNTCHS